MKTVLSLFVIMAATLCNVYAQEEISQDPCEPEFVGVEPTSTRDIERYVPKIDVNCHTGSPAPDCKDALGMAFFRTNLSMNYLIRHDPRKLPISVSIYRSISPESYDDGLYFLYLKIVKRAVDRLNGVAKELKISKSIPPTPLLELSRGYHDNDSAGFKIKIKFDPDEFKGQYEKKIFQPKTHKLGNTLTFYSNQTGEIFSSVVHVNTDGVLTELEMRRFDLFKEVINYIDTKNTGPLMQKFQDHMYYTILHELGHSLGMDHNYDGGIYSTVMKPYTPQELSRAMLGFFNSTDHLNYDRLVLKYAFVDTFIKQTSELPSFKLKRTSP